MEEYVNKKYKSFWDITNKERISVKNSLSLNEKILLTEKIQEEKVNSIENKMKIYENIYNKQLKKEDKFKRSIDVTLKSFYNKSLKKLNTKNIIFSELATTRENFKSKFNFHKESEISLLNILRLENEINDLNQCLEYYNNIKNSEFKTDNMSKIHKVISTTKEKLILNDIAKFGLKNKELMRSHFDDYVKNNWDFNLATVEKLMKLIGK